MVVVYSESKKRWTPPGGGVESVETIQETAVREIKEETNMRVIKRSIIGYQDVMEPTGVITQVRSVCLVEPYGDFVSDPDDGEITEIKLIDPKEYKHYFNWMDIGDHLTKRAIAVKARIELE